MGRRKRIGCTYVEQIAYEVQWYRANGKYPDRIKNDDLGREYIEHDFSWNRRNRFRRETIRDKLANYVAYRVTGIKR